MMTDPIADMLTRIRNGLQSRHAAVEMPASKLKSAIAEVLKDEGYIKGFQTTGEGATKTLKVELRYVGKNEPVLSGLKRISKPGSAGLLRSDRYPARVWRARCGDHFDLAWCDERRPGAQAARGRRNHLPRLVRQEGKSHVSNRTHADPAARPT